MPTTVTPRRVPFGMPTDAAETLANALDALDLSTANDSTRVLILAASRDELRALADAADTAEHAADTSRDARDARAWCLAVLDALAHVLAHLDRAAYRDALAARNTGHPSAFACAAVEHVDRERAFARARRFTRALRLRRVRAAQHADALRRLLHHRRPSLRTAPARPIVYAHVVAPDRAPPIA